MTDYKQIIRARSTKKGIIFYSNTFPEIGVETYFDNKGKIHSKKIATIMYELSQEDEEEKEFAMDIVDESYFIISLDIILIFISILFKKVNLILAALYFSIFVSFRLLVCMYFAMKMRELNGNGYSEAKFHSAEHMVVNAYKELQKIPTLEESKQFSRFCKICGSKKQFLMLSYHILNSLNIALIGSKSYLACILVGMLICILLDIASRKGLLSFMQAIYTAEPSNRELELAIRGLEEFEKMEEQLKENPNKVIDNLDSLYGE